MESKLGEAGTFGEAWRVPYLPTHRSYALKVVNLSNAQKRGMNRDMIEREA